MPQSATLGLYLIAWITHLIPVHHSGGPPFRIRVRVNPNPTLTLTLTLTLIPGMAGRYPLTYRPLRDGWLIWPCWLTDSGRLNHKMVTHPASCLALDTESSPAETSILTTMLCRQLSG